MCMDLRHSAHVIAGKEYNSVAEVELAVEREPPLAWPEV